MDKTFINNILARWEIDLDSPSRILVAMSGGVDSSVVAAGLQYLGHDVLGVTLQLYNHGVATKKRVHVARVPILKTHGVSRKKLTSPIMYWIMKIGFRKRWSMISSPVTCAVKRHCPA